LGAFLDAPDTIDRYGTPGGPLVIALHGAVANRKTWLPLARALPARYELWCPDLPGHGARADEPFAFEAAIARVRATVDAAAPRRPILAGDSLGGYLALAVAARDRERCIAAVCAGGCTWTMTGAPGMLARASDLPFAALERVLGTARLERVARALLGRVTDAETAREIARAGLRLRARGESLRELRGFDLEATVRRIAVPIAIVNGAFDWPTRLGEGALARATERATITIVPNVGHGVGFFAAPAFAAAIETLGCG
jgi:pimeloyl-ACP methyl ester carboxylesterase